MAGGTGKGSGGMEKWKGKLTDQLVEALLSLKTKDEVYAFLDDVATISEIQELSQRLEVARLLQQDCTYPEIKAATGASSATVSRVRKCLDYGSDGYKVVLERLRESEDASELPNGDVKAPV